MQKINDKYLENKNAAYELKLKERYNASVSRFYYSIYQKMMVYILRNNKKTFSNDDPHVKNRELFLNIFIQNNPNKTKKEINDIRNQINDLKKLRIKADYLDEGISKNDADYAELTYNDLDKIIYI
ncbi:hypothetical protein [uncultured Tyzzerella sp.]|uniref:hypothetical protein n=1 Tax=uncultured Tyzzerella sp. TaxID=2321398 RepID=UPI0029430435|nr:hypothetical protein [uncultured Tyzzerella sp.]